ncbi:MAG TPA: hypothetical protein VNT75_15310 [Symbiobacteriaceae bacterium]|nr:hypothetical protein [Symbiobacteriaceae bacterium]
MQIGIMLFIVLTAVIVTLAYRRQRDLETLRARLAGKGGTEIKIARAFKGHPFADTGRGWWVWRIDWRSSAGEHRSYALTTREGIKEWRD